MEEQVSQIPSVVNPPVYRKKDGDKKSAKPIIITLIVISVVLILGGLFFFLGNRETEPEATPTPDLGVGIRTATPMPTEEPEPADFTDLTASVENGTGIAKEASYLQEKLEVLGFKDVETGNADSTDYENTEVIFSKNVKENVIEELTSELEKVYQDVKTKTGSTGDFDVVIITGLRKGQTAMPEATEKATASPTPTSSATASPSPTATTTPTPTTTPATP